MCLICVEFNKNRMTFEEVKRALPEMIIFANDDLAKKHYLELQNAKNSEELNSLTDKLSHSAANLKSKP